MLLSLYNFWSVFLAYRQAGEPTKLEKNQKFHRMNQRLPVYRLIDLPVGRD